MASRNNDFKHLPELYAELTQGVCAYSGGKTVCKVCSEHLAAYVALRIWQEQREMLGEKGAGQDLIEAMLRGHK